MASIFTDNRHLTISEDVAVFLHAHEAEAALATLCELADAAFPESTGWEVALQEDPDEVGRSQVVLLVMLPRSMTDQRVQAALKQYHERLVQQVPLAVCPLFALIPRYALE